MKKRIIRWMLVLCFMILPGVYAFGGQGDISVYVKGEEVAFDVPPQIIDGRTMVPVRAIFEAMGAEVTWDGQTQCALAKKGAATVKMTLGSTALWVDGQVKTMDVSPAVVNGRTLAPAKYVAESFGYKVIWDEATKSVWITENTDTVLTVHFLDVGQADAALVESDGTYLLIDGGNVADSDLIYAYLSKLGVTDLDYVVGTHAHEDHMGGLSGALTKAKVGKIYAPSAGSDAAFYTNFKNLAAKQGLSLQVPEKNESFALGNARVTLMTPAQKDPDNLNNTSILVKVVCGSTSFLFTGDAEREEEQDILSQNLDLDATVLKAGHHGSDTSSSYVFLREVMPEYVVISVGKNNSYGHPGEDALSRFRDAGAKVYRTDMQGDITFESDGTALTVATSKNENAATNPTESSTASTEAANPQTGQYIGNVNSQKFHLPSCRSLPAENNRVYFSDRMTAVAQGYDPCGICKP